MEDQRYLLDLANQLLNKNYHSMSEMYNSIGSKRMSEIMKVQQATILNWVRREGGTISPRGGANHTRSILREIIDDMPDDKIASIRPCELARQTGFHPAWCCQVLKEYR